MATHDSPSQSGTTRNKSTKSRFTGSQGQQLKRTGKIVKFSVGLTRFLLVMCYFFGVISLLYKFSLYTERQLLEIDFKPIPTGEGRFPDALVQSPSQFCSEFGRHIMLQEIDITAEDIGLGVILCLRMVHPHQASPFGVVGSVFLGSMCKSKYNSLSSPYQGKVMDKGRSQRLVDHGPASSIPIGDVLVLWKKRNNRLVTRITKALNWFTFKGKRIPVSESLENALVNKGTFDREHKQLIQTLSEGDLFEFVEAKGLMVCKGCNMSTVMEETMETESVGNQQGDTYWSLCGLPEDGGSSQIGIGLLKDILQQNKGSRDLKMLALDPSHYMKSIKAENYAQRKWFDGKDGKDEYVKDPFVFTKELNMSKSLRMRFMDNGTALVGVITPTGSVSIAFTSLYSEFGSGVHNGLFFYNNFMQIFKHSDNDPWLRNQKEAIILPFSPYIAKEFTLRQGQYAHTSTYGVMSAGHDMYTVSGGLPVMYTAALHTKSIVSSIKIARPHIHLNTKNEGSNTVHLSVPPQFPQVYKYDLEHQIKEEEGSNSSTAPLQANESHIEKDYGQRMLTVQYTRDMTFGAGHKEGRDEETKFAGF